MSTLIVHSLQPGLFSIFVRLLNALLSWLYSKPSCQCKTRCKAHTNHRSTPSTLLFLELFIMAQNLHSVFEKGVAHSTPRGCRCNQNLKDHHGCTNICSFKSGEETSQVQVMTIAAYKRKRGRCTEQNKLKKGVVFADSRRMNLGRWKRKVPVPREGLWCWKRGVTVVDGSNCKRSVSA